MFISIKNYKVTLGFIIIWVVLFLVNTRIDLLYYLAAKGIDIIGHEYYRFITGPFLHFNLIHLLANVVSIFWAGYFIEKSIGSAKFAAFGFLTGTIAEIINSFIFRTSLNNIGGSVYVFAFLGLIAVTQIFKAGFSKFHFHTRYGNWIVSYAVIGNIPFLRFMGLGTIVIHLLAFITGALISHIRDFL